MRKVKQLFSFFLFISILFSTQLVYSQTTTAAINGTVVDQNGNPLPSASIIVVHIPTGSQYGTSSRTDGKYNVVGLRVGGPYKATVSFVGYTPQVEEGFNLELGQNLRIDFKLPEQAVQLTGVTITAEKSAVLSQARTGASQNVSLRMIESLPTTSRSFSDLAKFSPLVSGTGLGIAGRSSKFNNIQLDGAQFNDIFGLGSTGTPGGQIGSLNPISLDAIGEFQIVIAPYDVRQGSFTGGGVNAITKSGTNKFFGSAYFFGRNQQLVGKYTKYGGSLSDPYSDFKDYSYGATIGGPVIKDKLFFFANAEIVGYDAPTVSTLLQNGTGSLSVPQVRTLADQVAAAIKAKGYDPGTYNDLTLSTPTTKFFIRFDYNLAENHQLTVRHNFVDATSDRFYNSPLNSTALVFNSQPYQLTSTTNSSVLQLTSTFGNKISNELIFGYTTIRDKRHGKAADAPEIKIVEQGISFYAGPERFSSNNQLDQDIIEITDNFNYFAGSHTITLGTHNEFYKVYNLYGVAGFGAYEYTSLANFVANKVNYYQRQYRNTSLTPGDYNNIPAADFNAAQFGFYIQDEWLVLPQLKITLGLRADIPTFANPPDANPYVPTYFPGYRTDAIPSGNILWSPRVGFNWDVSGDRTTQLRGGLGIFSGKVPYVMMSNNYGNTGTFIAEVRNASAGVILPYISDALGQYIAGDPRVTNGALGTPNTKSDINMVNADSKMPQLLRFNVAVDQQLPEGFVGTAEILYSKTINDMLYRKINLKAPMATVAQEGSGIDGRPIYGGTSNPGATGDGSGYFLDVSELYNTSDGYQYNLVLQLQRSVARGFSVNMGYSYGQAYDRNSLNSSRATSMMNYNPIDFDPNAPKLTHSQWEIENRLFASISYVQEFFKNAPTTITLFYNGQSGSPYSYTIDGDLNNDNFKANDLIYIPRNKSEILLGKIVNNQYVAAVDQNYNDLFAFINNDSYLSNNKGKISERNAAKDPWQQYLDLSIKQDIPDLWGFGRFQLSLDIQNVLNLLSSDWGRNEGVYSSTYTLLKLEGKVNASGASGTTAAYNRPVYSFNKKTNDKPFSYSDSGSRWKMMLGIRYSF